MPVAKDATCYNMDHEYRGIAVIINNDIFEGTAESLPDRNGSLKDVIDLQATLFNLDFEVLVWNNLYYDELIYRLTKCMYLIRVKIYLFISHLLFFILQ